MYRASPLYGINFKGNVRIKTLRPEMLHAISVARAVFIANQAQLTVTDAWRNDPDSLHYYNLAVDLRAKNLSREQRNNILGSLQIGLGTDYQVILHGQGDSVHYHIEFDPLRVGTLYYKDEKRRMT